MTRNTPLTTGRLYDSRADHRCAKEQVVPAGKTR
jgi:hypothetical protein